MDRKTKIGLLRELESGCLSVCRYLLGDDGEAHAAAERTLVELYACGSLWTADDAERQAIVRRTAVRVSLARTCRADGRRAANRLEAAL